jgi:hypothetical protein
MDGLDAILNASDLLGVLIREVPVRLLIVSMAGCLLESPHWVCEGTIAAIHISVEGREYSDDIRIVGCSAISCGAAAYRIGTQFLWAKIPGDRSLRLVINQLQTRGDAQRYVRLTDWEQM